MKKIFTISMLTLTLSACSPSVGINNDQTYQGYPCQDECLAFKTGFDQAQELGVTSETECHGFGSDKNIVGCKAYAHEYQVENLPDSDLKLR